MSIEPLKPGALLAHGHYKIRRAVAEGGFAITYEALDTQSVELRTVVLKEHAYSDACYRASGAWVKAHAGKEALHKQLIERVMREADILKQLTHPHLVKVGCRHRFASVSAAEFC
jgi:serine/threonine protein kinase